MRPKHRNSKMLHRSNSSVAIQKASSAVLDAIHRASSTSGIGFSGVLDAVKSCCIAI